MWEKELRERQRQDDFVKSRENKRMRVKIYLGGKEQNSNI